MMLEKKLTFKVPTDIGYSLLSESCFDLPFSGSKTKVK